LRLPWKTWVALKFFTVLKYFYHSEFLSNLRLPWKQFALKSLYWIYIFIIQDFLATCACPENRVCPQSFQDRGGGRPSDAPPRTSMHVNAFFIVIVTTYFVKQTSTIHSVHTELIYAVLKLSFSKQYKILCFNPLWHGFWNFFVLWPHFEKRFFYSTPWWIA